MLRSTFFLGAALSGLVLYACGSSTSVKKAPDDTGPDASDDGGSAGSGGAGSGGKASERGGVGGSGPAAGDTNTGEGGTPSGEAGSASSGGAAGDGGTSSEAGEGGEAGTGSLACSVEGAACPGRDGFACVNHECVNVAGNLSGLLWELPCTSDAGVACNTIPNATVSTVLGGASGVTYDVTLHFRGIVEQKTYTGGCSDGSYWLTAGATNGDSYNVYELEISSPPQTFYLNRGTSSITNTWSLDYTKTIRVDAGATVTLFADTVDNQEIKNMDSGGTPLTIPGVSVTQPYNGQFIQMDVDSVTADPVGTNATVGSGSAGSALSFNGSQLATVADAASLQPNDLTQEAWFNLAAPTGSYSSVFGKTYGGGSQDSYTMWFQSNAFDAGVGASSPSGAPSVPFTAFGEWHHAALTYNATAQLETLYLDGLPVVCLPSSGAVPYDTHALLIGADIDNGSVNGFWNGALDEVRLFSTARTPEQVWADMHTHSLGTTTGLVGEWTFDEGSGQTLSDSSGHGNAAVLGTTNAVEASDPTFITSTAPH